MTAEEAARWIANEIIGELKGRRGLRHEWEAIDDECKEEIAVEWAKIARLAILTRERAARVEALRGAADRLRRTGGPWFEGIPDSDRDAAYADWLAARAEEEDRG